MKCRHSWVHYIGRGVIGVFSLTGVLGRGMATDTRLFYLTVFAVVTATIVIDRLTNYLTFDGHTVEGRTGLIRRKRLTSAVGRIDYCEYKRFLLWNSIKIGTGSNVFQFRNMTDGKSFVDAVNLATGRR